MSLQELSDEEIMKEERTRQKKIIDSLEDFDPLGEYNNFWIGIVTSNISSYDQN